MTWRDACREPYRILFPVGVGLGYLGFGAAVLLAGPAHAAPSLKLGGELRYRLEVRDDFTFNDAAFEDDAISLVRTRLQADLTVGSPLRVFLQGQDSESFAQSL